MAIGNITDMISSAIGFEQTNYETHNACETPGRNTISRLKLPKQLLVTYRKTSLLRKF